jgi:hypothetical protein
MNTSSNAQHNVTLVNPDEEAAVQPVSQGQFKSYGEGLSKPGAPVRSPDLYAVRDAGNQMHYFQTEDEAKQWSQDYGVQYGLIGGLEHPLNHLFKLFGYAAGDSPQQMQKLGKAGDVGDQAMNLVPTARSFNFARGVIAAGARTATGAPATADDTQMAAQTAKNYTGIPVRQTGGGVPESTPYMNATKPVATSPETAEQKPASPAETAPQSFAPVTLTPENLKQTLPGLTEEGYANALQQANSGVLLPTISDRQGVDNATRYFNSGARPGLLGGQPPTRNAGASGSGSSDNRATLDQRTAQSPYSGSPGSYPQTVSVVNAALKRGGIGLSSHSLATIKSNLDQVDKGNLTHAQASSREFKTFAKDALNPKLPFKDRFTAAVGSAVNATLGPAYMAEKDVSEHVKGGPNTSSEKRVVVNGMMTNDPVYNH